MQQTIRTTACQSASPRPRTKQLVQRVQSLPAFANARKLEQARKQRSMELSTVCKELHEKAQEIAKDDVETLSSVVIDLWDSVAPPPKQ